MAVLSTEQAGQLWRDVMDRASRQHQPLGMRKSDVLLLAEAADQWLESVLPNFVAALPPGLTEVQQLGLLRLLVDHRIQELTDGER